MRVAALMMVRNEADLVATNIRYHASVGITDFFVIDNGSTDRTPDILAVLADEVPGLRWTRDDGPYRQAALTTALAHEAHRAGADWVVPIDADEIWFPGRAGFAAALADTGAAALEVQLLTFVQRRDVIDCAEGCLTTMTRRVDRPRAYAGARAGVESGEIAFVEMAYPAKWVSRSAAGLTITPGNHAVDGLDGTRTESSVIQCLHAPLRARSLLNAKAEQGRRLREIGAGHEAGWHVQRWTDLDDAGRLYDDWAANSWAMDGADAVIEPGGGPRPVVHDTRLRDLVLPFVGSATPRRSRWRRGGRPT